MTHSPTELPGQKGGAAEPVAGQGDANITERPPCVLGIDPGFGGGLAFLTLAGEPVRVAAMPVLKGQGKTELDVPALVGIIRTVEAGYELRLVVVERVHSMPKQGLASTFAFGRNFGEVLGATKALGLPLELPLPAAWKRVVLAGTQRDKAAAIAYCARRFPTVNLMGTPRSRVPNTGIADAVCLAEWGRRLLGGSGPGRDDRAVAAPGSTAGDAPATHPGPDNPGPSAPEARP